MVGRPADGALEQIADPVLQDAVGGQTDRILDPLGFEILVDFGIGEARVGAKIDARHLPVIPRHDRLQHGFPAVGAVNVARTQGAAFQIAELVEHEQRMIAGAVVMAVPDAHLLFAVRRTDARNPCRARRLSADGEHERCRSIGRKDRREPTGSFPPQAIASRSGPSGSVTPRNPRVALPPTIQRIAGSCRRRSASFTSSYPASRPNTDCRKCPTKRMTPVLAGARVGQRLAGHRGQSERIVEFAVGEQTGIGGHHRSAKLEHQPAVEIEPEYLASQFTPFVRILWHHAA